MARRKQVSPLQRIPSGEVMESLANGTATNRPAANARKPVFKWTDGAIKSSQTTSFGLSGGRKTQLVVCVAGIYASFLSWALLQERITKTPYESHPSIHLAPSPPTEYFRFPVVLNTVQSFFASLVGGIYLLFTQSKQKTTTNPLPSPAIFLPLLLISITSSLASPFGYASLAHVDYLTFVLAKSCKLLPVMFLHLTLFQKRYPMYKYGVVFAVTAGVALFTISHPVSATRSPQKASQQSSLYGLALLSINLLFDGLTNTIQDHIFTSPARYGKLTGPQMMVAQNIISTWLTISYLLITPQIPSSLLPAHIVAPDSRHELISAMRFLHRHPNVRYDVLAFAACGAIGQVFIFATLERFSSLLLVTVTVTRKMLTMLLSVLWFGKSLTPGQWAGVGLVFVGVGGEGVVEGRKKRQAMKRGKKEK